ncbi:MAG: response regulator [Anaerolineae bacterium]|nr:response regulator [Anaerolineae bacterium]
MASLAEDILIVDDEPDARLILKLILRRVLRYPVREASSGAEALELVCQQTPRLIILDLTMPDLDGVTFLQQVRANDGMAKIPVVVFTTYPLTEQQVKDLCIPAGMVIQKGNIKADKLGEIILSALDGDRLLM